ncbi:DUF4270 family protein [Marinoscillum luteum]|uniref:DUF4270 family protein n=1 Tax=Marinoscillum luteum TaxID=861051 RepID=A0ABW7NB95_9BACT
MIRKSKNSLLRIFILALVWGCSESSLIGDEFFGDENFQVSYVDSVSLQMYTVKFDSLPTSGTGRLMVGRGSYDYVGDITAESYFLLLPASDYFIYDLEDRELFDSVTLVLTPDGYTYGLDEDVYRWMVVERLSADLAYRSDGQLYNISEQKATLGDLFELGRKRVRLSQDRLEEIEITLNADFGESLFEKIREKDEIYYSDSEFQQYLNGLRVRFDSTELSPFLGFDTEGVSMRLYYSNPDELPITQKYFEFSIDGAPHYTRLEQTNVDEAFAALKTLEDEVSSDETGHVGLVVGGLGYAIRVDFPSIRNLLLEGDDYLIASAELRLYPTAKNSEDTPFPERLKAFYVNDYNVTVTEDLTYATLHNDDEFGRDTYYTLDVSTLVENLLEPLVINQYAILITMDDDYLNTSINSLALGDASLQSELILYTISTK